jgi:hypothetical protein
MSNTATTEPADYVVTDTNPMLLNDEGQAVVQAYREAEKAYDALQQSWLHSARITLTASAEYNDQGGTYRSVSNSVTQVTPAPGAPLPQSLVSAGALDDIEAIALVEEDLDDNDYDLYCAFNSAPDDYDDLVLDVHRPAIAHLLCGARVSGAATFLALFPQLAGSAIGT